MASQCYLFEEYNNYLCDLITPLILFDMDSKNNFGSFLFHHNLMWDMILKVDPEFNPYGKINI